MKSHAFMILVALFFQGFLAQTASAAEELVVPPQVVSAPETGEPPVAVGPLASEFEIPCEEFGSPLTLMQWSYGDGADGDVLNRPLESDRPYFTKSASVVGRGTWQLETGYVYGRESYNGEHTFHSFPEANLRMGVLAEWFEVRVGWTYLSHDDNASNRDLGGASDPYVGIKLALTPQDEMLPETAILIDTNLSLEQNDMEPGVDLIYRWRLNDRWSMGGSSEFRRVSLRRHDAAIGFAQTWIFERRFGDALTGYVEWAMLSLDTPPDPDTSQIIDGGLLYLVSDNVQLDASIGYGLNELALDYYCGFGVTLRR